MEEHRLWITELVNRLIGKPIAALLAVLGVRVEDPQYPVPNHLAMELVVFAVAIVFFLWLKRRLSVDRPGAVQQCMEALLTNPMGVGVRDLVSENIGHGGERHVAILGSIGIFVLLCNLISLVPGFTSPTAAKSVPLGCAVVVFLYYNWCGIRANGVLGYGKHFLGPSLPLSPLMVIVETFSHLARLLSLTVRLWVNMFVSELLYGIFLMLTLSLFLFLSKAYTLGFLAVVVPVVFPPMFILLHVFVGVLQAFVFTILPVIYVAGAVAEER